MKVTVSAQATVQAEVEISDDLAPEEVIAKVYATLRNDQFQIDTDRLSDVGVTAIEVGAEPVYEGAPYELPLVPRDPEDSLDDPHIPALQSALGEQWATFTRRTDYPKLGWLIAQLEQIGIPCKIEGMSYHAPILMVQRKHLDAAWEILDPLDEVEDDHRMFAGYDERLPTLS